MREPGTRSLGLHGRPGRASIVVGEDEGSHSPHPYYVGAITKELAFFITAMDAIFRIQLKIPGMPVPAT